MNLLIRLDMNVIITSHAKNEYGQNMAVLGQTFDCYKKLDYLFDLILELQKRGDSRYAVVKGSRLEGFPESETFKFSYDEMSRRYSKEMLEKEVTPQVLASKQDLVLIEHYINLLKIPEDVQKKWLDKAKASTFSEMDSETINKCINHLKSQIEKTEDK
jgi:hypothetical protein